MTETTLPGGALPHGDSVPVIESASAGLVMRPAAGDWPDLRGSYVVTCLGPDGGEKWREMGHNLVVDAGALYMLGATFNATTQIAANSWYMGLKDTNAPSATDTLASHSGWSELNPYTGNRPLWGQGAASGTGTGNRQVTNGTNVSYSITSSATVGGIFVCSAATGTSGTLFNATAFSTSRAVANGDTLLCTYTLSI